MRVQAPSSHCPHPVLARVPEPGLQAALESYGGQEGGFLGACKSCYAIFHCMPILQAGG